MNRSKLLTTTALATVMSATAAHAELSLSDLYAGSMTDSDGGVAERATSTSSMYVTYRDTLDNGMGITLNISASGAGHYTDVSIDTGMGTLNLGDGADSAVDAMDGNAALTSLNKYGPRLDQSTTAKFNDGDAVSGASIMYTSPSINGFTIKVSRGNEVASADSTAGVCYDTDASDSTLHAVSAGATCAAGHTRLSGTAAVAGHEAVMSYAVSGSVMGLNVAAGVSSIDYHASATADSDPSFVTASYTLGGITLGYGMYDSDSTSEETIMGASTSIGGMTVGVAFSEDDDTTDTDYMHVGAIKSLGAMSYSVEYLETDSAAAANAGDSDTWNFTYTIGF